MYGIAPDFLCCSQMATKGTDVHKFNDNTVDSGYTLVSLTPSVFEAYDKALRCNELISSTYLSTFRNALAEKFEWTLPNSIKEPW